MGFDRNSTAQVGTLRAYIDADTPAIGLSLATKTDVENAALMNSVSTSVVARSAIGAASLLSAVASSEYAGLTAAQRQAWSDLITTAAAEPLNMNAVQLQGYVASIWASGTLTRTNLLALRDKSGATYAESVFGEGTVIGHLDVAAARSA